MRTRIHATLLALCLLAPAVQAQDGTDGARRQAALEMFKAMRGEQMMEQFATLFYQSLAGGYRAQIASAGSCPAAEQVLDAQAGASRDFMLDAFKRGDYLNKVADIYARTFTEAELRDATAFFGSATGQKFLDKQPELMQQGAVLGQSLVAARRAELEALSKRLEEQMRTALAGCKQAAP